MTNNTEQRSRKKCEEEFRRNFVLDIAEGLFAEKGFAGTTVADIAERSELAKGSLYQLFQSKEEIIAAIISRKVDQIRAAFDDIFKKPITPAEKVREIIRTKLRTVWESRQFARIFLHELRGFHWSMDLPLLGDNKEKIDMVRSKIVELLAEGQQCGEFRNDIPPSTLFAAVTGFSNAIVFTWLCGDENFDLELALNQSEELYLYGISPRKEGSF